MGDGGAPRYQAIPSFIARCEWLLADSRTGLCVRQRGGLRRFSSEEAAARAATILNTERIVCRSCRHKALKAECVGKICPHCLKAGSPRDGDR